MNRALVYGLARSGVAATAALERDGVEVVQVDRQLENEDDLSLLDGVDVVVKSPGVPGEAALVGEARRRGIPVWSEVELGWRRLTPRPFVGVTGTNGKTTTAELLGAIFRAAGREVAVAGNVGTPLTSIDPPDGAWIVCELSSFQLEDVDELACEVAVLLNLEPDHLDRHGTFDAYRDAKLRIFERARTKIVPRGLGLDGSSSPEPTRSPPSRSSPARTTVRTQRRRRPPRARPASTTTRSPRRCAPSPASRTGSSSSPSEKASAGSTTRRRRTPRPRGAASRPTTLRCG